MKYPLRPDPVGICKCGHKYNEHHLFDEDFEGTWFQTNIGWLFLHQKMYRKECRECMCSMYEQVKIIDEKTGNEIQSQTGVE